MLYLCRVKPLRHYLRGFLIAAWAGDKIAEFSFPEISFHFSLRPWFFFVSPAYAGKSPAAAYACPGTQDHPRVCGEKLYTPCVIAPSVGSPPRMREKARQQEHLAAQSGITPACAGKSREYRVSDERSLGSPPRMRGKDKVNLKFSDPAWITPAYAGKRAKRGRLAAGRWDHPRVCGEKALIHGITFPSLGSPPRMRGKAHALKKRPLPVGITPAYAGKSSFLSGCTRMPRDHPRVCGEKRPRHAGMHAQKGSPPRMRGKVTWCCSFLDGNRITPAYAGKSV